MKKKKKHLLNSFFSNADLLSVVNFSFKHVKSLISQNLLQNLLICGTALRYDGTNVLWKYGFGVIVAKVIVVQFVTLRQYLKKLVDHFFSILSWRLPLRVLMNLQNMDVIASL